MKDYKVSIIIPAYNCEKTIERCIESIMKQTYTNIEIIIVNDGSSDKTLDKIKKYNSKKIKIINKENEGVSAARNAGINLASGDYIMFIDADDWIEKNTVNILVNETKKRKIEVIRYCCFNNNEKEKLYELSDKIVKKQDFEKEVMPHFLTNSEKIMNLVMLLFIKREVIIKNEIYFDNDLYMMEDVVYYQKLLENIDNIYFLNCHLYHYEFNPDSATNSEKKYIKNIKGIISSDEKLYNDLKKRKINDKLINEMVVNHLRIIINYIIFYLKNNGIKKTRKLINELYQENFFCEMLKKKSANEKDEMNKTNWIIMKCLRRKKFFTIVLFITKVRGKINDKK